MVRALGVAACGMVLAARAVAVGDDLAAGVHPFVLTNGLAVVVAVRPELELVAVNLTVDLGAVDDPPGQAGMAHLLEHVTLSGSVAIGSLDPAREAAALEALDHAHAALAVEEKRIPRDVRTWRALDERREAAERLAASLAEPGEILGGRLEARGAIGLNATTSADATQFFAWLPPRELPVWLDLESQRLRQPILRRFYRERQVVLREIEALTGGRPTLQERLLLELFPGSPLGQPRAGDPRHVAAIDRPTALAHVRAWYRPDRIALAVAGNVDPAEVHAQAARAFGDWRPAGVAPPRPAARRPTALSAPRVRRFNSEQQPVVFFALPTPDTDAAAVEALAELMSAPGISPLHRELVERQELAWSVGASPSFPARKMGPVFLVHVYGNPGVPHRLLVERTRGAIEALERAPRTDVEGAIRAAEMRLAGQLDDASSLVSLLALSQAVQGSWRAPFDRVARLRALDAASVRNAGRRIAAALVAGEGQP